MQNFDLGSFHRQNAKLFRPKPWIYWTDLVVTAVFAYGCFALAAAESTPPVLSAVGGLLSALAFYRAIFFNHEIVHAASSLRGFSSTYNFLFGFAVNFPTYIYEPHRFHHSRKFYGTKHDSEYAPVRGKFFPILILPFIVGVITPFFLFFRFALVPLFLPFIGKTGRALVFRHLSTFAMLPTYERPQPSQAERRRWYLQDLGCFIYWWTFLALIYFDLLPLRVLVVWMSIAAFVFVINHLRAMVAHTYESDGNERSFEEQVGDTTTVDGPWPFLEMWAPLSVSYHALHHLYPSLPYHSLRAVHRELMESLPTEHPYRHHIFPGYSAALLKILRSP